MIGAASLAYNVVAGGETQVGGERLMAEAVPTWQVRAALSSSFNTASAFDCAQLGGAPCWLATTELTRSPEGSLLERISWVGVESS